MGYEIFTEEWVNAWEQELNRNEKYREAAQKWEGETVLVLKADPEKGLEEDRTVILDLWHGKCRVGKIANDNDLESAPYIISASPENWKQILDGKLDPLMALMRGKLQLTKGKLTDLLPYITAAKEMISSAASVDTEFPEGWE
tara:strand:- start:6818 stop:7246 length:429 start_codon:yes stop_codon:yes gene_type:complete